MLIAFVWQNRKLLTFKKKHNKSDKVPSVLSCRPPDDAADNSQTVISFACNAGNLKLSCFSLFLHVTCNVTQLHLAVITAPDSLSWVGSGAAIMAYDYWQVSTSSVCKRCLFCVHWLCLKGMFKTNFRIFSQTAWNIHSVLKRYRH